MNDLMDNTEKTNHTPDPIITYSMNMRVLGAAVLISVIFGAFGGLVGALYLSKFPSFQKIFTDNGSLRGTQSTIQQGIYKEESATINVVKKDSPAVVSIVISKDLSKIPGFGLSPFGNDFFNQFYSDQQSPQSDKPNIQEIGAGSGFFVTSDGLILTNKHVIADEQASYTVITNDGKSFDATVMARDPVNDLAILKVNIKDAPTLPLVDSSQIEIGQQVVAIGNSLGQYQNTVTSGIVSGIGRSITAGGSDGSEQLEGVIQTDAAINPGNSGGPLLNLAGQVIGINTAIDQQGQSVGFAIPANDASKALAGFQKNGKIARPFLGIRYVTVTQAIADN